jgi:hypothetical protein
MSSRRRKTKIKKPRFPRAKWAPGQAPRIEPPEKGRGSYDRAEVRKETRQDTRDLPEES